MDFLFAYYDYRLLPKEVLDYLIKVKKEVYRKEHAVMFKWKGEKDKDWRVLYSFICDLDILDDYSYICIGSDCGTEEVGCLSDFDAHIEVVIVHKNDSDIEKNIDSLKADLNIEHAGFDRRLSGIR